MQTGLAVTALCAVAALLAVASLRKIGNADFWWQYATGRQVAQHGIPTVDVFSFTRVGEEWIELRWLFCWGFYQLIELAGPAGALWAQMIVLLASFGIVAAIGLRRSTLTTAAVVLVVAVFAASQRFMSRPEQVSYLMMAVFLLVIQQMRSGRRWWLWALPPLQIVWTNAHTLFILGPLLVGLWFVAELWTLVWRRLATGSLAAGGVPPGRLAGDWRPAAIALAATTLACLVNPYGLRGFAFPFLLATEIHGTAFKAHISEFAGTFAFSQTYVAVIAFEALIGLCALAALMNLRRLDPFWLLACLAHLYLAVIAIRNLPLFCLVAVPFVIHTLSGSPVWGWRAVASCLPAGRAVLCSAVIALAGGGVWSIVTDRFHVWQNDPGEFGVGLAGNRYPARASVFLESSGRAGPLFNTMFEGSYLLARGFRVFIDPRLEVYGEEFFAEYVGMLSDEESWRSGVARHGIGVAVVDLGSPVVSYLHADAQWRLVFFDSVAAVFMEDRVRDGLPALEERTTFEPLAAAIRAELPPARPLAEAVWWERVVSPSHTQRVATFLLTVGQPELAEPFVADGLRIDPRSAGLHRLHGAVLDRLGRPTDALVAYERAVALQPADPAVWTLVGRRYFTAGEHARARHALERSLHYAPQDAMNRALLARIALAQRDLDRAISQARLAVELEPANVMYRKDLAKIHAARREADLSISAFEEAAKLAPEDCTIWRDMLRVLIDAQRRDAARGVIGRLPAACADHPDIAPLLRAVGGSDRP